MRNVLSHLTHGITRLTLVCVIFFASVVVAEAATLSLSPSTGVYQSGTTFTARVVVNTSGQAINAADATINFNPKELSVVSVNRSSSIFNLWVTEPTFSNSGGTISFSGGSPSGYTGSAGTVMTITFRVVGSGTARVNFGTGSVLANDGKGTNVLSTMSGGSYTLQAASAAPVPEEIEYVAPANTPGTPVITSTTHGDSAAWHRARTATLNWTLPAGVTEVRTLLDKNPTSVPTRVYETPISSITLEDLDEGVSYFHLQFRNADGWGRVAHYRLAVDTVAPSEFVITQPEGTDVTSPVQTLTLNVTDATSDVQRFMVRIDANEPYEYILTEEASSTITLPTLEPGYHTVVIEAFDEAANSLVSTYSFTIAAFDKPVFTEYPTEINEQVIPVIKGMTRPLAEVVVTMTKLGSEPVTYTVNSDETGQFAFIPEGRLSMGVYELSAVATDQYGAMSESSDAIRIAVQQPGFVRVGSFLISVVSVIIPLVALVVISIVGFLYLLRSARHLRASVTKESAEALTILNREFTALEATIRDQEALLVASRKTGKLTNAEADTIAAFAAALQASRKAVEKEIKDVKNLTS